jgi:hypothetical protein
LGRRRRGRVRRRRGIDERPEVFEMGYQGVWSGLIQYRKGRTTFGEWVELGEDSRNSMSGRHKLISGIGVVGFVVVMMVGI